MFKQKGQISKIFILSLSHCLSLFSVNAQVLAFICLGSVLASTQQSVKIFLLSHS